MSETYVSKPDPDGEITARFAALPRHVVPHGWYTEWPCDDCLRRVEYPIVLGSPCRDVDCIREFMIDEVWHASAREDPFVTSTLEIGVDEYCRYVQAWADAKKLNVHVALEEIRRAAAEGELTRVEHCHGDLTVSNVIERWPDGQLVLIDPGSHRGLPCRELDESKLLESLDGMTSLHTGVAMPTCNDVSWVRPVHWALLVTHYVRMLRHAPGKKRSTREFALMRIANIQNALYRGEELTL